MLFLLIVWGLIRLQCGSADVRTLFVRQVEKRNTPKVFLLRQSQREKRLTFFEQDSRSEKERSGEFLRTQKEGGTLALCKSTIFWLCQK